jgi:hypothetical protein
MTYISKIKKFATLFTIITFTLSVITSLFVMPFSFLLFSNDHNIYISDTNGHNHIVFHHSKENYYHKDIENHSNEDINLDAKENDNNHHDHIFHIETIPISIVYNLNNSENLDLSKFYRIDLAYTKIFDYVCINIDKELWREINFSPHKISSISKSLKTVILTI